MMRVLAALSGELLFQSKIAAAATVAGAVLEVAKDRQSVRQRLAQASWDAVIVELDRSDLDSVALVAAIRQAHPTLPIIAYCSHVAVSLQAAAKGAGCTAVCARSSFVKLLPELMAGTWPSGQPALTDDS